MGEFQFSAPSFSPLNPKEQQFTGHPLTQKPNQTLTELYQLLGLAGERW